MEQQIFIDRVFDYAATKGFDAFELYMESGTSLSLESFETQINKYSDSAFRGVNFRGIVNGKSGAAYSEVLDEKAAFYIVDKAYEAAKLIENDDCVTLIETQGNIENLNLFNPALETVENTEKIDFITSLDRDALAHESIDQVSYAGFSNGSFTSRIINSHGVDISYNRNYAYVGLMVVSRDDQNSYTAYDIKMSNDFDVLKSANVEKNAIEKVLAKRGATPVPSGTYKVLFSPEASGDLLSVFISNFNAEMAQKGLSLLKGKIGTAIASDMVTIVDDPHLKDGIASAPFDGEGVATFKKSLIEKGEFKTFLHNMNTARKDGVKTTGNAHRSSFKSGVGIAPSNAYFVPSNTTLEALYDQAGDGIIITELDGLHAGANAVSGDFSLSCRGFVLENGKKGRPFKGVVVSGNYFKLLKNVVAVADDLTFGRSPIGSPTIYVRALDIAGE